MHCSAFQVTAAGTFDLLQLGGNGGNGGGGGVDERRGSPGGEGGASTSSATSPGRSPLGLREWSASGTVSGGSYSWPEKLSRVSVLSPFDFSELVALALSRRLVLQRAGGGDGGGPADAPVGSDPSLSRPPVCAPMALVIEVSGTSPEGDATSAQIVLWDLPGSVPLPTPPPVSYTHLTLPTICSV